MLLCQGSYVVRLTFSTLTMACDWLFCAVTNWAARWSMTIIPPFVQNSRRMVAKYWAN